LPGTFEHALSNRVEEMLDACTACGKCFEACPITGPAGIAGAEPRKAIAGVLEILRNGGGPEASVKWANSCVLSGECIKVCDYGVNPRFLLSMARVAMARTKNEARLQRKLGVDSFRLVARDVMQLSRMQLT
jgi:Fe-S oxidoreductase